MIRPRRRSETLPANGFDVSVLFRYNAGMKAHAPRPQIRLRDSEPADAPRPRRPRVSDPARDLFGPGGKGSAARPPEPRRRLDASASVATLAAAEPGTGSVRSVIRVPGDRPRDRADHVLAELRAELLEGLGVPTHHRAPGDPDLHHSI